MRIKSIRFSFIISQIIVIILAISYTVLISDKTNYTLVLLYSMWNILSYGRLFFLELKYAPDFNPFQILCLSCLLFTGLNGLDIYWNVMDGETLTFGVFPVNDVIHLGLLYLSIQHVILFSVFYALENKYQDSQPKDSLLSNIQSSSVPYYHKAIVVYGIVWILRLINLIIPLSAIGSIFVYFVNRGHLITLILLLFERIKNPNNKSSITLHWIIVALEIVLVLGHGMKEDIIVTLVPFGLYLILTSKTSTNKKSFGTLVPIGLILSFILFFVFPYISVFRSYSTETGKRWSDISVSDALEEYSMYIKSEGKYAYDETERGIGYLMYRAGAIGCNAWAIDYAQNNGPTPQFAKYCAIAVVPRIIWRQKPQMVTGGMVSSLARGDDSWLTPKRASEYGNSLSLGFIGACYFSFGIWGAIFLVLINSLFLWYLWAFCRGRLHYNLFAIIILINYIMVLLKDFEAFQDCGFSFMATHIAYMVVAVVLDKLYYRK